VSDSCYFADGLCAVYGKQEGHFSSVMRTDR